MTANGFERPAALQVRLRVKFTPHMARHDLGKKLNRSGAGLKMIAGALDTCAKNSLRYQDADFGMVREADTGDQGSG
jgi:hypothetical protein